MSSLAVIDRALGDYDEDAIYTRAKGAKGTGTVY
jgi:hypothetical protein